MITLPGSAVATQVSSSDFVFGSQTLIPGGPAITLSGTPVSLALKGTAVAIGSSIIPLTPAYSVVLTLPDGETLTQDGSSGFIFSSQTLIPGGSAITVDGTRVSLASGATEVVFGSVTEFLTTTAGMGDIIMSGFGDGPQATATTATETGPAMSFTGNGERGLSLGKVWGLGVLIEAIFFGAGWLMYLNA